MGKALVPFRVRITSPGVCAPWLRTGTGERMLYSFGVMVDARMEKVLQGTNAGMPTRAQDDAINVLGGDLLIVRGITEARASYGARLQRAFDAWRLAGTARGLLSQILGYLLALTPAVRFVASRYDRSTYPATLVSTRWDSYPAGRNPNIEPVTVYALAGGNGELDWDSVSQVTGSWGWWEGYLIIYSVAPNAWCNPAQAWGLGSVYTPAAGGYYSTVSGGAYELAGSYAGSTQAWGAGSYYTAAASGYYSTVTRGAYADAGIYGGVSQAWGVDVTTDIGQSFQIIARQFKSGNTWIRAIVCSFDATLFNPAQPADGTHNPAGTFGQWSIVNGGVYADSRFTDAVYGGEVT